LEKKLDIYLSRVSKLRQSNSERTHLLLELLKAKSDSSSKQYKDAKNKYNKAFNQSEDIKNDVLRSTKSIVELRIPHIAPKEPDLPELEDLPYVPIVPSSAGLDSRGKKKKALTSADLKALLEAIEQGNHDGAEELVFPENLFPSQAQALKIGKAVQTRNSVHDARRTQELNVREQTLQYYDNERLKWEALEKKRLSDLEKAKKESRKLNLKYDCLMNRVQRLQQEMIGCDIDSKATLNLKAMHDKCLDSFKLLRFRAELEKERQQKYISSLRLRLLRAVNARRYAMTFPSTAMDKRQFEDFSRQAEDALRYLLMEIFECKSLLEREGMRLRHHWYEEEKAFENESIRINVSIEILRQKDCYDQILSKYKVEIIQLLVELEKYKLVEADKDDVGIDTIDDLGERFAQTRTWTNPNVIKCQRMVDLLVSKVDITEGLGRSTASSQRYLVDAVSQQSRENEVFFSRDSWLAVSDYERAQQLTKDTLYHIQSSRKLLQQLAQDKHQLPMMQYQLAMNLREQQLTEHHQLHEQETKSVRESSELILDGARKHLSDYREATEVKLTHLEQSIIDLSRECQKVREELLQQQMVYDDKMKVLWAFIHTLQTALQQISAKMEIAMEEQEQVVIESRLMADNTRHQLRLERQHSANLTFVIHSQRGNIRYLKELIKKVHKDGQQLVQQQTFEKNELKKDLWETVFTFSRLCTDIDLLFEFFATRIANLSGSRAAINDQLAQHNAALVLAALCKNPKPIIRRAAARALGNMGWNGFVEKRILLWDCIMYWKMIKSKVIAKDAKEFDVSLKKFNETGQYDAVITMQSEVDEFVPNGNLSLRSIIKQRRQWALRAARRIEGPNIANQKLLNVRDGVLLSLLQLCVEADPIDCQTSGTNKGPASSSTSSSAVLSSDWEISRNAALAISISSYEPSNHAEMIRSPLVLKMLLQMCALPDAEIQTHAAVTIANLCYRDEEAQRIFGMQSMDGDERGGRGERGVIAQLLRMLDGPVADVLEASTAALANLTCYCDENCETVFACNGLPRVLKVITQSYSENLLDLDQNDEVHANASEVLANISRYSTKTSVEYFTTEVIDALVVMCASSNKQLRRHVSLVLGNIAQSETCRSDVGSKGGIEALFLALEDEDTVVKANALWALSNLMWHPPNQERAGRFMSIIVDLMQSPFEPILVNSCLLLGNVLYYSTPNRVRFLDIDGAFELLIDFVRSYYDDARNPSSNNKLPAVPVLEACLRSLLSLSYLDSIAMWMGAEGKCIPIVLFYLQTPHISKDVLRNSLEIICNLCLHHANRRIIYEQDGISAIVPLHTDPDPYIRDLSVQIIEHLEDITPAEVLARARELVGLERMVTLASNDDPLVRAVAAEAIGEEVWRDPSKQARAQEIGAIDSLLAIVHNPEESLQSLLPAIWSLRNLQHNHAAGQAQFGYRDGVKLVCNVIRRGLAGVFDEHAGKLFEACVACLISAVTKEPRNSRRLVMIGLDALVEISEESSFLRKPKNSWSLPIQQVISGIRDEGLQALVNNLLLSLAPYNYVVCKNCGHKQDLHGTSCFFCGHRLLVDVDPDKLLTGGAKSESPTKNNNLRQSQSANSLSVPPWRHAGKAMDTALPTQTPVETLKPPRPSSSSRARNGGAMGELGAGMVTTGRDEKKSYFSRSLPAKQLSDEIAQDIPPK
jgi:HEAT repeat protein